MRYKFIITLIVAIAALSLGSAQAAPFAPLIPGDVDRDGQVEPGDYRLAYGHVVYGWPIPAEMVEACDMSGDGRCDRRDLSLIAREAGVRAKSVKGKK